MDMKLAYKLISEIRNCSNKLQCLTIIMCNIIPQAEYKNTSYNTFIGILRVSCVLYFKNCPRVPGGSRQGPHRAPTGQITGLNRGIFLAGSRVTFRLELKVIRARAGRKMDGTRSGSLRGSVWYGQKHPGNCPGSPFL